MDKVYIIEANSLILVGNKEIHGENPIMKLPHREINIDGVLSRRGDDTTIYVWDN